MASSTKFKGEMLIRLASSTHVDTLTKKLEEQFLNKSMVDATLVTEEGEFIHAHKFILSAGSPYFKDIIDKTLKPSQNSSFPLIICLSGIKYAQIYPLIKYMYTGCVDIPQSDLKVLVKTAFQLKISGLYEEDKSEELDLELEGESNDLSIEAFIKEEQEEGYDLGSMEEDNESNEYVEGPNIMYHEEPRPSSFQTLTNTVADESLILVPTTIYTPPPLTKTSNRPSYTFRNINKNRNKLESLPFECVSCGNSYKCSKSLWRHRKYNCNFSESAKVSFVCNICTKNFSRADNLKRHTIIAHGNGNNS